LKGITSAFKSCEGGWGHDSSDREPALSSNPSTAKKKKEKGKFGICEGYTYRAWQTADIK
jgi:hypothetical protein